MRRKRKRVVGVDKNVYFCPMFAALFALVVAAEVLSAPVDALPTDALPTDALRSDALPTDALPTDALPTDALPTDTLRTDALPTDTLRTDTLRSDALRTDTLREVVVRPLREYRMSEIHMSDELDGVKAPPSLGQLLDKLSPGLTDKMMHPFAIKQRKQERRRKRVLNNLEKYESVKTDEELLREAYEKMAEGKE